MTDPTTVSTGDVTTDVWSILIQVLSIIGTVIAVAAFLWWLVAPRVRQYFESILRPQHEQLRKNGGTSLVDRVERIDERTRRLAHNIDSVSTRLDRTIEAGDRDRRRYVQALRQQGIELEE